MQVSFLGKVIVGQLVLGVLVVLLLATLAVTPSHHPFVTPPGTLFVKSQLTVQSSDSSSTLLTLQSADRKRGLSGKQHDNSTELATPIAGLSIEDSTMPPDQIPLHHTRNIYKRSHRHGDLPYLPKDRSPDDPSWNNSVAICACMFQENTTDVREWLLYHRWLGVDHIYLTENSKPAPEGMQDELQEFIDDGFVTFRTRARPAYQHSIYLNCMADHRHKHNWMAFIDLDEFIVLRKEDATLKEFLDGYKHEVALNMHWVMMGSSHRQTRPQTGGVLRSYRECVPDPSPMVKSITNTFFLANTVANPHSFEYREARKAVDEHRKPMPWRYPRPEACGDGTIAEPSKELHCRPVPHVENRPASADYIAVFHYITKSEEDFLQKMERGGGGGKHRTRKHFDKANKGAVIGGICDGAYNAADACCNPNKYVASPPQITSVTTDIDAKQD